MPQHQAFPFLLPSLTFLLSSKRQCFLSLGNCHISLLQASGKHGISEFSPSLFLTSNLIFFFFFFFCFSVHLCIYSQVKRDFSRPRNLPEISVCASLQTRRLWGEDGSWDRRWIPQGWQVWGPTAPPALHNHRAPTDITLGQRGKKSNPVLIFLTSINF